MNKILVISTISAEIIIIVIIAIKHPLSFASHLNQSGGIEMKSEYAVAYGASPSLKKYLFFSLVTLNFIVQIVYLFYFLLCEPKTLLFFFTFAFSISRLRIKRRDIKNKSVKSKKSISMSKYVCG